MNTIEKYTCCFVVSVVVALCFSSCCDSEPFADDWPDTEPVFRHVSETGISVTFRLLNEDGVPATTFRHDEDVVFDLVLKNETDSSVTLHGGDHLGFDFFSVYNKEGKYIGVPWDDAIRHKNYKGAMPAGAVCHWQCSWKHAFQCRGGGMEMEKWKERKALPCGSYVSRFRVSTNDLDSVFCMLCFNMSGGDTRPEKVGLAR